MKKIIILIYILLMPLSLYADKGIRFEHGATWSETLSKAKAEGRLVFVDFYTDWCGPCYNMAKTVFPLYETGEFFNSHFVNAKIDAEKGEGVELARRYNVRSYPTYLFIDPNTEEAVHRSSGWQEPETFIWTAQSALDPQLRSTTLLSRYEAGDRDREFLISYIRYNSSVYKREPVQQAFKQLIDGGASLTEPEIWDLYDQCVSGNFSWTRYVSDNHDLLCRHIGKEKVDAKLARETRFATPQQMQQLCEFDGKRFNVAWTEASALHTAKEYEKAAAAIDAIIADTTFNRQEIVERLGYIARQAMYGAPTDFWFDKCVEYLRFIAYNNTDRDDARIHYDYARALETVARRAAEGKTPPPCLLARPAVGKKYYDTHPDDLKQKPSRRKQ